jgi:hypothetical protein
MDDGIFSSAEDTQCNAYIFLVGKHKLRWQNNNPIWTTNMTFRGGG